MNPVHSEKFVTKITNCHSNDDQCIINLRNRKRARIKKIKSIHDHDDNNNQNDKSTMISLLPPSPQSTKSLSYFQCKYSTIKTNCCCCCLPLENFFQNFGYFMAVCCVGVNFILFYFIYIQHSNTLQYVDSFFNIE